MPGRSERRIFPRVDYPCPLKFRFAGELVELSWREGVVLNFGAGGLGFTTPQLVEEGSELAFRIYLPTRSEPYELRGRIIWSRDSADQLMEYGAEFVNVTPDKQVEIDELVRFLGKGPAKSS